MLQWFSLTNNKREIETGCTKLSIYEACSSQFVTCNIVFKMEYELISSASSDVDSIYSDVEPSDSTLSLSGLSVESEALAEMLNVFDNV